MWKITLLFQPYFYLFCISSSKFLHFFIAACVLAFETPFPTLPTSFSLFSIRLPFQKNFLKYIYPSPLLFFFLRLVVFMECSPFFFVSSLSLCWVSRSPLLHFSFEWDDGGNRYVCMCFSPRFLSKTPPLLYISFAVDHYPQAFLSSICLFFFFILKLFFLSIFLDDTIMFCIFLWVTLSFKSSLWCGLFWLWMYDVFFSWR